MPISTTTIGGKEVTAAGLAAQVTRGFDEQSRLIDGLDNNIRYTRRLLDDHGTTLDSLTANLDPADAVGLVSVIETGYTIDNSNYVDVAASYHAPNPLGNFGGVFLVAKNYHGSAELVKVGEHNYRGGAGGGATFHVQLDRTFETVTFYFVSKNTAEATQDDWTTAPSTTVALNGSAFTAGLNLTAGGKNILQNPSFESNNVGTSANTNLPRTPGTPVSDGWFIQNNEVYWNVLYDTGGGALPRTGIANLLLRLDPTVTVPNDSTFHEVRVDSALFPVQAGDIARISGWIRLNFNASFPAGVDYAQRISLRLCNSAGTVGTELPFVQNVVDANVGYQFFQAAATIPATSGGQTIAFARFECSAFIHNTGGAPFNPAGVLYADCRYDDLKCVIQSTSFDISAVNTAYGANGTSPLTAAAGGSANTGTISIAATTLQYGDGQISYSSGTISPVNDFTKYYVYADDPTFSGGAVSYQATVNQADVTGANGRIYFGSVTTPVFGGGGVGGGGGGSNPCVTGNTKIRVSDGTCRIADLFRTKPVATLAGCHPITEVLVHDYAGPMCDMGDGEYVTPGHRVYREGKWVPAGDIWPDRINFSGKVYNLHVENEHNYVLANGAILHNFNKA